MGSRMTCATTPKRKVAQGSANHPKTGALPPPPSLREGERVVAQRHLRREGVAQTLADLAGQSEELGHREREFLDRLLDGMPLSAKGTRFLWRIARRLGVAGPSERTREAGNSRALRRVSHRPKNVTVVDLQGASDGCED